RLNPHRRLARLLESGRERHAEAGGVRRGDELLGVRAWLPLEAGREAVRPAEDTGARLEGACAVLELSFPHGGRLTGRHLGCSLFPGVALESGGAPRRTLRLGAAPPRCVSPRGRSRRWPRRRKPRARRESRPGPSAPR